MFSVMAGAGCRGLLLLALAGLAVHVPLCLVYELRLIPISRCHALGTRRFAQGCSEGRNLSFVFPSRIIVCDEFRRLGLAGIPSQLFLHIPLTDGVDLRTKTIAPWLVEGGKRHAT
jgi:hypothetical protein